MTRGNILSAKEGRFSFFKLCKWIVKTVFFLFFFLQLLVAIALVVFFMSAVDDIFMSAADGSGSGKSVSLQPGSALILDLKGTLVEQATASGLPGIIDENLFGDDGNKKIVVHEVVRAIRAAAEDDRIEGIVLDVDSLYVPPGNASKLHYIADTLADFRKGGKTIVAVGDFYSQDQYLLASYADRIYMNPFGNVLVYGYGNYRVYVRSLLDKLKITTHIFRAGTFKSAVEPLMRDDMSAEAKEASAAFLGNLWEEYTTRVETARALEPGVIGRYASGMGRIVETADGDMARAARQSGLVDVLASRTGQAQVLVDMFGAPDNGNICAGVGLRQYLALLGKDTDPPNTS